MRILVTDGMDRSATEALIAKGHEITEHYYAPDELGAALREFDAVIVRSGTKIRKQQLEQAQGGRLKLIIRAGVGVDNIDVDAAQAMGIAVRNTPRASSNAVAELAIGLMFSCARYISIAGHTMRQDKWEKKAYGKGFELHGKTLGVIGFGRIGRRITAMASGIGMRVIVYEPSPRPQASDPNVIYLTMPELLRQADVITINAPALGKPIIDEEAIREMKDGVVIINTSRGCNIDEKALLSALNSGKVRAAGLDVWSEEPSKNQALYSHPAVSCTPHIGASTKEAQERVGREVVTIINSFPV